MPMTRTVLFFLGGVLATVSATYVATILRNAFTIGAAIVLALCYSGIVFNMYRYERMRRPPGTA
jgi:hypothetical protein